MRATLTPKVSLWSSSPAAPPAAPQPPIRWWLVGPLSAALLDVPRRHRGDGRTDRREDVNARDAGTAQRVLEFAGRATGGPTRPASLVAAARDPAQADAFAVALGAALREGRRSATRSTAGRRARPPDGLVGIGRSR